MIRRRVLIVSHVFPPQVAGGAPRMGQFARLLPEHGWDVTVVTAKHGDGIDRASRDQIGSATIVEARSPASAVVKRGQAVPRRGPGAIVRRAVRTAALSVVFPDREVFWVPGAIAAGRKALEQSEHHAVLATFGPPSDLLVGHALARRFRLPLVVDFRDLWSSLPMPVFTTPLHRAAARRLEHAIVRHASRLTAVAPRMAEDLARDHGLAPEHAIAITNGFDPADLARAVDDRAAGPRPFRLVYSGSIHTHYNLEPFWTTLRTLADEGKITPATFRVEFVGNLAMNDVRSHGIEPFVEARPYVPHARVFEALAAADALLVVETPGYYARYGYAAKVFDYVLTGKPVLALVEAGGNTARLLGDAGVGYCAEPGDAAGVRRALEQVLALHGAPPHRVDIDAPPLSAFNRRHLVAKLASVLDEVVATEPHGRW